MENDIVFGSLIQFDIMPIIDEAKANGIQNDSDIEDNRAEVYEGMNSDSEEDFEATYEASDKDDDGDVGGEAAVENVVVPPAISQPMDVAPFMCNLNLNAMNAPKFLEYANIGVADPKHGEFRIGMEYSSKKRVIAAIRSYTISTRINYNVYESEPTEKKVDRSKLDSNTVAETIGPLVETDPFIKVKSIIAEVQSKFNYTISYQKT
ncbi:hypothetical protein AHAS_Ahas02G0136000 [Arachis hypogaea]